MKKIIFYALTAGLVGALALIIITVATKNYNVVGFSENSPQKTWVLNSNLPFLKKNLPSKRPAKVWVPILSYHYIRNLQDKNDTLGQNLSVKPENFAKQLRFLKDNGYISITLNDLVQALNGGKKLPQKPVILTFDDGYRDFYENAFPLLQKYKTKATIYVITDFIADKERRYLTWDELIKLDRSGYITIGSHSKTHSNLTSLPDSQLYQEIVVSKKILERKLRHKIAHFCYPAGRWSPKIAKLVDRAGYKTAVTTKIGSHHSKKELFFLKRIRVSGGTTLKQFAAKVKESYSQR